MKKSLLKRIITIVLVATMSLSFGACSDSNKSNSDNEYNGDTGVITAPVGTVTEPEEHFVSGTIHKVNVTETENAFVTNGESAYKIVVGEGSERLRAATFIQSHISAATDAELLIVTDISTVVWNETAKYIVLDVPTLFEDAGLSMPTENLNNAGYYIKNQGNTVFIAAKNVIGVQQGAIAFLKYTVGYEMYAGDTVVYEKDGATMPNMDILECPDYETREPGNSISAAAKYGMGFADISIIPINGVFVHNSLDYLPPKTYQTAHPKWYASHGNELCYTANGNETERQLMIEEIARVIKEHSDMYPLRTNVFFTIEDTTKECSCDGCAASRAKYNGCNSAAMIQVVNAVNRLVQPYIHEQGRELAITIFAYNYMQAAPTVKNAEGKWEPIDDSVVLDKEIILYAALAHGDFNHSFYNETNLAQKDMVEKWSVLSNTLWMWLYNVNFSHYFYPLNSYNSCIETYRLCKANGAVYMKPQGHWNVGNASNFSNFKVYINKRALFNVNDSFQSIADDFFANYFRGAEKPMRQFFDELQAHMMYTAEKNPSFNGKIYQLLASQSYWPQKTLEHWVDLCEEAYEAIEPLKVEDPQWYTVVKDHITLESLFPRYALLELYSGRYTKSQLQTMRITLRDDCQRLNVDKYSEGGTMQSLYEEWGIA